MIRDDYPTADEMARVIGTRNWVVARRSSAIERRYGEDVVCLSPKAYAEAARIALVTRMEGHD